MSLEDVPRCQHIKINGTQCGSPALRRRRHCFFHDRIRREQAKIRAEASAQPAFKLPLLEDANCVQVALMKTIQMLASGRMDHKTAGLILYALQTASVNLRHADFEVDNVSNIVIDRDTVNATCINGPQWFEEDFDEESRDEQEADEDEEETEDEDDEVDDEDDEEADDEESEDEDEDEEEADDEDEEESDDEDADDEDAIVAGQLEPESAAKKPSEAKEISAQEARMKVQGVVQEWSLRKGNQDPTAKPG